MSTWTVITIVAFSACVIYLFALGTDWLLESRFRKVLFLLRRKEGFERHASHIQECLLTFQFLENMAVLHASSGIKISIETEIDQRWESIANVIRGFHSDPALRELCESLVAYKKQQQDILAQAFSRDSNVLPHVRPAFTDTHKVISLLTLAGRQKTHETFHSVCMQFSPLYWPLACIPLVLIAWLGFEVLRGFRIT